MEARARAVGSRRSFRRSRAGLPMTIIAIQGLRALAAGMVVVHHARHEGARLGLGADGPGAWLPWWAGVDVFFVISGFIIVTAAGPGAGGRAAFLARRVARVAPLYWLATLLVVALAFAAPAALNPAGTARDPTAVAAALLFWPQARPDGTVQPVYGLGWTLNYEMAFYALFALVLGRGRRVASAGVAGLLALLVSVGALWDAPLPLRFWADPIVLEFALGAGLALARAEGLRLGRGGRLALAGLGLVGLAVAGAVGVPAEGMARPLAYGLPALLLVAGAGLGRAEDRARGPMVDLLRAVGDASYALYLVHPFVLRAAGAGLDRLGLAEPPPAPLWFAGVLALSALAALLVHRLVEAPMTARLRRLLDPAEPVSPENRVRAARSRVPARADPP